MKKKSSPPAEHGRIPRKHPRVQLLTQVESQTSGATSIGRTENISQGGLLVYTRETFDASTSVIVRFNLSPGRLIEAQGKVVHVQVGVQMGIQFSQVTDEDRKAITEFVREACE
jgi:c-di-GMP-binding flagellar brake protein YcgR